MHLGKIWSRRSVTSWGSRWFAVDDAVNAAFQYFVTAAKLRSCPSAYWVAILPDASFRFPFLILRAQPTDDWMLLNVQLSCVRKYQCSNILRENGR